MIVSGSVQGVGFRWACREEADRVDVAGFVRNLPDGRVEAAFEGADGAVEAMVAWCRTGPGWAHVTGVEEVDEPPTGTTGFLITR